MTFDYKEYVAHPTPKGRFYQIEDNFYPSITTVLGVAMEPEKVNALEAWKQRVGALEADKIKNRAADRGTKVHLMCEQYLKTGVIDCPTATYEDMCVFNSIKLHLKKINRIYGQEMVLYSHSLQVAGRADLVGEYGGIPCVIDFKSSTREKPTKGDEGYFIQATFYAMCHNEMFGTDIRHIVIMMGSEKGMPQVWKREIQPEWVEKLINKTNIFYDKFLKGTS